MSNFALGKRASERPPRLEPPSRHQRITVSVNQPTQDLPRFSVTEVESLEFVLGDGVHDLRCLHYIKESSHLDIGYTGTGSGCAGCASASCSSKLMAIEMRAASATSPSASAAAAATRWSLLPSASRGGSRATIYPSTACGTEPGKTHSVPGVGGTVR